MTPAAARALPLNQRILWARKRKGISQERLAAEIGTTRRHMIRIEKGQTRNPGLALLARIAEVTEQPRELFLDEDDEEGAHLSLDALLDLPLRAALKALGMRA